MRYQFQMTFNVEEIGRKGEEVKLNFKKLEESEAHI